MINKQEIMMWARQYDLPANTIEKDYVLNWLLAGISSSESLAEKWIFKGGTCLKKCYFEEYRFSEDLDFTMIDESHNNELFLVNEFKQLSSWVYENSGIDFPAENIRFEQYENPNGGVSIQGRISYAGPMKRHGSHPTIKLDLSSDEIVVDRPVKMNIYHPYSDQNNLHFKKVLAYGIDEIFAEKLRALTERMRPRDLFDVIHLHNDKRWQADRARVIDILQKKCDFKHISVPTMGMLDAMPNKQDLIADWDDMLSHQISNLKPYHVYWEQLPAVFSWLYE